MSPGALTDQYRSCFEPGVSVEGRRLAENGRVMVFHHTPVSLKATVSAKTTHMISIALDGDLISGSCDCPVFSARRCAHLWAGIVHAERRGLLRRLAGGFFPWSHPADPPEKRGGPKKTERPRAAEWRNAFNRLFTPPAEEPDRNPGELVYTFDPAPVGYGAPPMLEVSVRRRLKSGAWGKPRPRSLSLRVIADVKDPGERRALELLLGAPDPFEVDEDRRSRFVIGSGHALTVLPALARTGRLHLDKTPFSVDEGGPWVFHLAMKKEEKFHSIRGHFERDGVLMPAGPGLIVLGGGLLLRGPQIARYDFAGDFRWIHLGLADPPIEVPDRDLESFFAGLYALPVPIPFEFPPELRVEQQRPVPHPVLRLDVRQEDLHAQLIFDYDGQRLEAADLRAQIYDIHARRLLIRDQDFERAARAELEALGFGPELRIAAERLPAAVLALSQKGWRVEGEQGVFRAPGEFHFSVSSGIDWFDLGGGVDFAGQIVPFPELLAALRSGKRFVKLGDGSLGLLPEEWLRRQGLFLSAGESAGEALRFTRSQAALLDALLAAEGKADVDATFDRLRAGLHRFEGIAPVEPPPGFQGELRPYQKEGLGWLGFLRETGLGGCLADDMGLGKTVEILAHLEMRRQAGAKASLVVVPRSLLFNWKAEAARFAPQLRIAEHWGQDRARAAAKLADADVLLTTYGTLRRDAALLKDVRFDCLILDEAQAVKNGSSDTAKAVRLLKGDQRLALSGTPIENHLGELWSLMEFLNPGLLGRASAFRGALDSGADDAPTRKRLAAALRPFILRRTKQQVAPELPERMEQTISVELLPDDRKRYDDLKRHYQESLLGKGPKLPAGRQKFQALEALLRLRQASCHSGLLDPARRDQPSAKLEILMDRLREVVAEGHKALVFSQFTSLLKIVDEALRREGMPREYLDGQTQDRAERVRSFQEDPEIKVFLISLKAGGVGLNLTAAEYVFLLDPWWNPAAEAQAIDRTHRIGQSQKVIACRLVAKDTVEEKVLELQGRKRELADAILGEDSRLVANLTREDLERLLS